MFLLRSSLAERAICASVSMANDGPNCWVLPEPFLSRLQKFWVRWLYLAGHTKYHKLCRTKILNFKESWLYALWISSPWANETPICEIWENYFPFELPAPV
jgi:hypothetical protein